MRDSGNSRPAVIEVERLNVWLGRVHVLKDIRGLAIPKNSVFAIMGPSGSGKTTLLKTFNRIIELSKEARVEGRVTLNGEDIFSMDPVVLRRRVGHGFPTTQPIPAHEHLRQYSLRVEAHGIVRQI
jgi:ABC-type phosphate transport system, ATPase component